MRKVHIISFLCIAILFSACSTGNKFASSFGKRKYTKGFYADVPSAIKAPAAPIFRPLPIMHQRALPGPPTISSINISNASTKNSTELFEKKSAKRNIPAVSAHPGLNKVVAYETPPSIAKTDAVTKTESDNSGEYNFYAIGGFILSVAGAVVTVVATMLTPFSIVLISLGTILCIYSLFIYRIYFSWLAILGLSITVILFVLVFV